MPTIHPPENLRPGHLPSLPIGLPLRARAALIVGVLLLALVGPRFTAFPAMAAPSIAPNHRMLLQTESQEGSEVTDPNEETAQGDDSQADADSAAEQDDGSQLDAEWTGDEGDGASDRVTPSSRGGSRSVDAAPTEQPSTGDRIAAIAGQYLGYRYMWGGSSPGTGFDCSGFAWFVYHEAGIEIPLHDLRGQLNAGPRIELEDLQPGDLVFFQNTYQWGLSHVGVYVGGGKFIDADAPGVGVIVSDLNYGFWRARFVGGSRPR